MKILYYDCFAGISGDMNLAAMIDLGVDIQYLTNELNKLNISGYTLNVSKDNKNGIFGTRVDVILHNSNNEADKLMNHNSSHNHSHSDSHSKSDHKHHKELHHHSDDHNQKEHLFEHHSHIPHNEEHTHKHEHRNLAMIEQIIDNSLLNNNIKLLSKKIFNAIATAEAKIHNKDISEIHFHEVGAIDSIVDIVGAAICFDKLNVDKIYCSTIELGGGFVKCAHGMMPVPAPATVELLKNIPTRKGTVNYETTTPTGASILASMVDVFTDKADFKVLKTAYGVGHRNMEIPNLLRVYIAEISDNKVHTKTSEINYMIECNLDDMTPEHIGYLMEKLFKQGALDVFITPIIMKKGRPGSTLSVLSNPADFEALTELILTDTSTFGIRNYQVDKTMLTREFQEINTKWGKVRLKTGYLNARKIKSKPEYEDCKQIANENNISLKEVFDEINRILGSELLTK